MDKLVKDLLERVEGKVDGIHLMVGMILWINSMLLIVVICLILRILGKMH